MNTVEARRTRKRDALKKQVLAAAGIPLIRLITEMSNPDVHTTLDTTLTQYVSPEMADKFLAQRLRVAG